MGHLAMLMGIKVHYNPNTFTKLEFSTFAILCFKIFWNGKIYKCPGGIRTHELQIRS